MHDKYYENRECPYYPCHGVEKQNCMFCFCPLYTLSDKCGGNYKFLEDGTKDCSDCFIPHTENARDYIISKWEEIKELAKKK